MKMEAEIGVMQLQAKECQSKSYHPVVGRDIKKHTHTQKEQSKSNLENSILKCACRYDSLYVIQSFITQ